MNKNELITEIPVELQNSPASDIDVHTEGSENIEMFKLPVLHEIGKSAVGDALINTVPGVESSPLPVSGAPVNGSRDKVVIGDLDDWKGGNPNRIVGFKDR